jgi:hypothetical protein
MSLASLGAVQIVLNLASWGSCPVKWLRFVTAILPAHAIAASSSLGSSPPSRPSTLAIDPIEK